MTKDRKQPIKDHLPDVLVPGLDLVFVGTAAGRKSAQMRAYYAHPGNRFWRTIHEVGITPRLLAPHEYPQMLELGIGFTDMSKIGVGNDSDIAPEHFDRARFEKSMKRYRPRAVAFTSKKAASVWMGKSTGRIELGRQPPVPDFPQIFVMCSPSGLATGYWSLEPWAELAQWLKGLKAAG